MRTYRRMLIGLVVLVLALPAQADALGEAGAQFLKIGVGARACAMGEAFAGIADDPSAIYWNPAGLAQMGSAEVMLMQNFWLLDMSQQSASAVLPSGFGTFGLAFTYSPSGDIPKYEDFRYVEDFSASDIAGTFAFATRIVGGLSSGIGVKFIQQKIEEESATGFAFDAGLLCRIDFLDGLGIGFAAQNLGQDVKFIEQANPLPLTLRGGAALRTGPVTVAGDVCKLRDDDPTVHVGGECLLAGVLALRAGFMTRNEMENALTFGFGIQWRHLTAGYGYVPFEEIEDTHRVSVGLSL